MAAVMICSGRIICNAAHKSVGRSCVLGTQLAQVRFKQAKRLNKKKGAKESSTGGRFIPRALLEKMRGTTRTDWDKEASLARLPVALQTIRVADEQPVHFFHDIMPMLREHNAPEMNDNMDGIVEVEAELDMRTDKLTRYKANFTKTIMLPHNFDEGKGNSVLVFCENEAQQTTAMEGGAVYAGGMDIIKAVEKGEISSYEYNHVVATPTMLPFVVKLRKILKNKYPDIREGSVGEDVAAMVERFKIGKTFSTQTDLGPDVATVRFKLGPLTMSDQELRDNLMAYFKLIEAQKGYKTKASEYGSFIMQATMSVQGCMEKFYLHLDTAHLDEAGVTEWLASDAEKKKAEKRKRIQTGPKITRPLLEEEIYWTLSEEEIAQRKAQDWDNRIKEQRRLIDMSDKQRRAHHQKLIETKRLQKMEDEKYEKQLAEVYRQRRLSRLSKEVRDKIDLERQFRVKVHI